MEGLNPLNPSFLQAMKNEKLENGEWSSNQDEVAPLVHRTISVSTSTASATKSSAAVTELLIKYNSW